jgi:hypothetical protein
MKISMCPIEMNGKIKNTEKTMWILLIGFRKRNQLLTTSPKLMPRIFWNLPHVIVASH